MDTSFPFRIHKQACSYKPHHFTSPLAVLYEQSVIRHALLATQVYVGKTNDLCRESRFFPFHYDLATFGSIQTLLLLARNISSVLRGPVDPPAARRRHTPRVLFRSRRVGINSKLATTSHLTRRHSRSLHVPLHGQRREERSNMRRNTSGQLHTSTNR